MDKQEHLLDLASANGIDIDEYELKTAEALAIPLSDGSCAIAIAPSKIKSQSDGIVKLAHELGHCIRGVFYTELCPLENRERCEHKANVWAARRLVPWPELKEAVRDGKTEIWELSEYFSVTEDFMRWVVNFYTKQKGYSFE